MLDPNSNKSVDKHGQIYKKEDKKDVGDKDWDEALEESIKDYRIVYLSACGPGNYEKELQLEFFPQGKWQALVEARSSPPARALARALSLSLSRLLLV